MSYIQSPSLIKNPFFEIKITHLPTNQLIVLPGWVTQFSDNFTSNWNPQNVYGRMDPLVTFENTQRQITLAFDVVSANLDEAVTNLANVNRLIEFLYPVYEGNSRTQQNTLKAAPLIGLEWTNLISTLGTNQRLVGFLRGVNYSPEIGEGGFIKGDKNVSTDETVTTTSVEINGGLGLPPLERDLVTTNVETTTTISKSFIPKKLNISLDYTVLHTHLVGWANPLSAEATIAVTEGGQEIRYYFGGDKNRDGLFPNAQMIKNVETMNQSTTVGVPPEAPGDPSGLPPHLEERLTEVNQADLQALMGNTTE